LLPSALYKKLGFNGLSNLVASVSIYSHVGQRLEVLEGAFRQHRDAVTVQRKHAQVIQARQRMPLQTLQLVV